jgi:hypothetical protein
MAERFDAVIDMICFTAEDAQGTVGAKRLLWAWIERNGVPQGVYCEHSRRSCSIVSGEIADANEYYSTFLEVLNEKFAKPPIEGEVAHIALLGNQSLDALFCFEEQALSA